MGIFTKPKIKTDWHNTKYSGKARETAGRRSLHKCSQCGKPMRKIKTYYKEGGSNTADFYCEHCNIREEQIPDYN